MISHTQDLKTVKGFESSHKRTSRKLDIFEKNLQSLRFAKKETIPASLKTLRNITSYFKGDLSAHMHSEETVLFPFIDNHVPRLEPLTHLFRSEHLNIRLALKRFEEHLRGVRVQKSPARLEKLRQAGLYLIYILKTHLVTESEGLYQIAQKELRREEKKILQDKLKLCR